MHHATVCLVNSSPLAIPCPICANLEFDDFECLETGNACAMRCAACSSGFHFAILQCPACEEESLICSTAEPNQEALEDPLCPACSFTLVDHDAPHDSPHRLS